MLAVHNFADRPAEVHLDLADLRARRLEDLLGDQTYEPIEASYQIHLDPYGYRWFRVSETGGPTDRGRGRDGNAA